MASNAISDDDDGGSGGSGGWLVGCLIEEL